MLIKPAVLDLLNACHYVSLSESTFQKLVRDGVAPKPRQLSDRRVGWLVSELDMFVGDLPVADLPPPSGSGYGRAGKPA